MDNSKLSPVALAHEVAAQRRLVGDPDAAGVVVWATGALDSDLTLVEDGYHVARKIETSEEELRRLADAGKDVRVLIPRSTPAADDERVGRRLGGPGIDIRRVGSLTEALRKLGLRRTAPSPDGAADAPGGPSPAPGRVRRGTWLAPVLLAALSLAAIAFGSSLLRKDGETTGAGAAMVRVFELFAADRDACIAAVMAGERLASRPLAMVEGRYSVAGRDGLCGLRFVNAGRKRLRLSLDGALQAATIAGGHPLFQTVDLDANAGIDLLFARPAAGIETVLTVEDAGRASAFRLGIAEGE